MRSKLSLNCDELTKVIIKCWNLNPLDWPKFTNICERLNILKNRLLGGIIVIKVPYFGTLKDKRYENIELHQTYNRLLLSK